MKLRYYIFAILTLTGNFLFALDYLSQNAVSLFGMKLMDDARDHLTLEELNSKIVDGETADLFYRVPISSKKNANYDNIFVIVNSNYTIHSIVGLKDMYLSLNECKEKVLKTYVSRFEDKYSITMRKTERVHTSFINHMNQVDTYEGGSFRFQCQESFDNDHAFWVIFQTPQYRESLERFYDDGF